MHTQNYLSNEHRKLFALLIITLLLLTLVPRKSFGQDNTLYLMPEIPQANQLNPAYFKLCRIYVELPVISAIKLNIRNTGFGYHDVFSAGTGSQTGTYVIDIAKLDNVLKRINYAQVETDIDLLGVGFGYKDWYITFGIANHSDALVSYPHDIVLLRDANTQVINGLAKPINLRSSFEATVWNSIGVSAAKEIAEGVKVGLRLKYLQGMSNVISQNAALSFNSANNPISLAVSMAGNVYSSFPMAIRTAPNGQVNGVNFDNSFNNFIGNFIFNGNRGVGMDAGVVFDPDDKTEFSASITDLGFIHWKKNTNNFAANRNFSYNGPELFQFSTGASQGDLIKALKDSVLKSFSSIASVPYFTVTPIKIFGGVSRVILPNLRAGAMTRIEIYHKQVLPSLSLSMNYTPIPAVAASLSYTIMNNKFNQIGAGISIGNRIVQFYAIADNIPLWYMTDNKSSLFWPYYARMLSLRAGLNLIFGCREKESKHHRGKSGSRNSCPAYN